MDFLDQLTSALLPHLIHLIGLAFAAAVTWMGNKLRIEKRLEREESIAYDAIKAGVQETYTYLVRDLKKAAVDGKLSAEERKRLQTDALERAQLLALTHGVELLKTYSERMVRSLIDIRVKEMKALGSRPE